MNMAWSIGVRQRRTVTTTRCLTVSRKYPNGLIPIPPSIISRTGYRRSVSGVDSIYYRIGNDVVEIMAILGSQDTDTTL